uniref:C-type lectin domain-containing protein n=1 Tax=Syphacia muris TaxID=451379 RepID=A0A0N5AWN6_9BILA
MMYKLILLQLLLFTIVAGANDALNELHSLQQNSDKPCLDNAFAFCQVNIYVISIRALTILIMEKNTVFYYFSVARKSFYFCMHSMYSSCINPYYLLTKADVSLKNVMDYIRVWNNLDFMCNGGFEGNSLWICFLKQYGNSWWICEDLRVSYGSDCPDLRCHVKTD